MAWLRRDPHKAFGFYPLDRFILGALRALHRCVAALKRFLTEPPPVNGKIGWHARTQNPSGGASRSTLDVRKFGLSPGTEGLIQNLQVVEIVDLLRLYTS